MLTRTEIIDIQYEIAMAIGSSLELKKMLRKSLASILRVLNCPAGGVLIKDMPTSTTISVSPIFSVPANAHKYSEIENAINKIPDTYSFEEYNIFTQQLPIKLKIEEGSFIQFFYLQDFGILYLYTTDDYLDIEFIRALNPLMKKMAIAAKACVQNEELERHREHLEELVSEQTHTLTIQKDSLEKANKELKELNTTKNKFFSIIAHDLRSPFNGIIGLTNIIVKNHKKYSKEQIIEFISEIHDNAKNTFKLLENLLDWSRIQTGKIKYSPEKLDLRDIISNNISLFTNNATKKNIKLNTNIQEKFHITADKLMLNTIIRNLISNAIKFTHHSGQVAINAKANNTHTEISVIDNGVGFSNEQIENLFMINKSSSTLGTNSEKGSGLGLMLCKEFVSHHGGELIISNNTEEGSCISFSIPL